MLIKTLLVMAGIILFAYVQEYSTWQKKTAAQLMGGEFIDTYNVEFQTKKNNCGPAALKMMLDKYGISTTTVELEELINLGKNGTSMFALAIAAKEKGLVLEGVILNVEALKNVPLPAILFVNGNHFVVADSLDRENVILRDPSIGRIKIPFKKFKKNLWNGESLVASQFNY